MTEQSYLGWKEFEVELYENLVDDTTILFHCFAENKSHAINQAFNAYPDSDQIINVMELCDQDKNQ